MKIKQHITRMVVLSVFISIFLALPAKVLFAKEAFSHHSRAAYTKPITGTASYYGEKFQGKRTASGEIFNKNAMTAAHRSLPFGTKVKVTNLRNGKTVLVKINDRGPHVPGRMIDLSQAAAKKIGLSHAGTVRVKLQVLKKTKSK